MTIVDRYANYRMLEASEQEGVDYRICVRRGPSGLAIMAPHGGDIEPGTSEVASALASNGHSLYLFEGTKERNNRQLHLASTRFDEPRAVRIARESATVVTIHGCAEKDAMVLLGGLHVHLVSRMRTSLLTAGFPVETRTGLQGLHPQNLCNGAKGGGGVQVELSSGLRKALFMDLTRSGRRWTTSVFERFVAALTVTLSEYTHEMALSGADRLHEGLPGGR
jgi:phage replication-related protein YjqB (UPF0714/DUF867 family)